MVNETKPITIDVARAYPRAKPRRDLVGVPAKFGICSRFGHSLARCRSGHRRWHPAKSAKASQLIRLLSDDFLVETPMWLC